MKYQRILAITLTSVLGLSGCITLDQFMKPSKPAIEQAALTPLNTAYEVLKTANVRVGPRISAEKIGSLPQGAHFYALGKTGQWIAIGHRGQIDGYVHTSLVQKVGAAKTQKTTAKKTSSSDTSAQTIQATNTMEQDVGSQAVNLDEVVPEQGINLDDL